MKKILIIGSGGAGKSTLARELGTILDLAETKRSPTSYPEGEVWNEFWGNNETISDQYQP